VQRPGLPLPHLTIAVDRIPLALVEDVFDLVPASAPRLAALPTQSALIMGLSGHGLNPDAMALAFRRWRQARRGLPRTA